MLCILVFSLATVASSRNVHYDDKGITAMLEVVGFNGNSDPENAFSSELTRQSKMVHSHSNYRQVTTETTEPWQNKQWHHHQGHGNFHEHHNIPQYYVNDRNHNTDPETRNTETNMQRTKSNPRTKTDNSSNPLRVNKTQTFNKTAHNVTKPDVIGTAKNNTNKISVKSRVLVDDNKTVNEAKRNNSANLDDDKWIWDTSSTVTSRTVNATIMSSRTANSTTANPSSVGVGDRANFSGDGCPAKKVKFGNTCIDED